MIEWLSLTAVVFVTIVVASWAFDRRSQRKRTEKLLGYAEARSKFLQSRPGYGEQAVLGTALSAEEYRRKKCEFDRETPRVRATPLLRVGRVEYHTARPKGETIEKTS